MLHDSKKHQKIDKILKNMKYRLRSIGDIAKKVMATHRFGCSDDRPILNETKRSIFATLFTDFFGRGQNDIKPKSLEC
jgi:hypothetical protein